MSSTKSTNINDKWEDVGFTDSPPDDLNHILEMILANLVKDHVAVTNDEVCHCISLIKLQEKINDAREWRNAN